jgi:hypothetical protein
MSAGREKDQKDFDLEQIVKIIDSALESDDPRIKDALRALMTITVLCTAEHPVQAIKGPLGRLMEDVRDLNRRIYDIEDKLHQQRKHTEPFMPTQPWTGTNPASGQPWTSSNPNGPKPMWGNDLTGLPDVKKWAAGDDPRYKGSSASSCTPIDIDIPF